VGLGLKPAALSWANTALGRELEMYNEAEVHAVSVQQGTHLLVMECWMHKDQNDPRSNSSLQTGPAVAACNRSKAGKAGNSKCCAGALNV